VGSALLGSKETIEASKKVRKMMGGSMRQCGMLAAAASFCLEHHFSRLDDDHAAARELAKYVANAFSNAHVVAPETNIVLARFQTPEEAKTCLKVMLETKGILLSALDAYTVRGVLHLDVPLQEVKDRLDA
jgi:threonine aldolase